MSPVVGSYAGLAARAMGWGYSSGVASFELISTTVLASSSASVTFNLTAGQQAAYKHLQLRMAVPSNAGANGTYIRMQLNGDTAANYSRHELTGQGSAVQSNSATSQTAISVSVGSGTLESTLADGHILDLLDAFSTTKNKTIRNLTGAGARSISIVSGAWFSTSAVSSIALLAFSQGVASTFGAGARFSIYGARG